MNVKKKVLNIQKELLKWVDAGWTLRPIRAFIGELVLGAITIAYLNEHIKLLTENATFGFAIFFVGLVLYFKNKH